MNRLIASLLLTLSLLSHPAILLASEPPPLMLANVFHADIRLADYLVSEKYDGVRGYWDGERLLMRGGEIVHAPDWFTAGWPNTPLDGELWAGRGRFALAVSTVRQLQPDDATWRGMHFMLFDLPAHPGDFAERDAALVRVVAAIKQPWVRHVAQSTVHDLTELRARLTGIVNLGGEGLVLHRRTSLYRAERSDDLLKFKLYEDAEARVIGHLPGKGKYAGMLGALEVETAQGLRFKLGAGLSDAERHTPPPLGVWVTYRYNGVNEKTGIPRFARYLRVRTDMTP
ncbi:DNA ligase [Ferriphaselus amnicola]|uniref:DNA ligase n=1 Tax=Ferriphaselus amnicola TaxID=1188319 RepID=A0A2Z6GG29_9PROT|nr:DNA ligase [Ferriphaselus amnicola]BBE52244.1 DNA ligase [Ferriphaselus amnicola]